MQSHEEIGSDSGAYLTALEFGTRDVGVGGDKKSGVEISENRVGRYRKGENQLFGGFCFDRERRTELYMSVG